MFKVAFSYQFASSKFQTPKHPNKIGNVALQTLSMPNKERMQKSRNHSSFF